MVQASSFKKEGGHYELVATALNEGIWDSGLAVQLQLKKRRRRRRRRRRRKEIT